METKEFIDLMDKAVDKWTHKRNSFNVTDEEKKLIAMPQEEYDKFMCERFPEFFANRNAPMTQTCMCWGFEIGEGWYPLLYELCLKLEAICKPYKIDFRFDQIKEKFGSGRFYFTIHEKADSTPKEVFEIINDLVSEYENLAYKICSRTGEYYEDKISSGWIYDSSPKVLIEQFKDYPEKVESIKQQCLNNRLKKYLKKEINYIHDTEKLNELKKFIDNLLNADGYQNPNPCD